MLQKKLGLPRMLLYTQSSVGAGLCIDFLAALTKLLLLGKGFAIFLRLMT